MKLIRRLNQYFDRRKGYGHLFLRLVIGWRLVDGTQDNVFSWERMIEFRDFLDQHGVAFPLVAAIVSVYVQFIGGIMIMTGALIRIAATFLIINFLAALYIAHIGTTFQQSFDALMMLFGSAFFLFAGAGKISVDEWLEKQNKI